MKRVFKKAYAKINLHLDITAKEKNGYHRVVTVMQSLSLCDDIEVTLTEKCENSISCNSPLVPLNEKNLAWRAAELFFEYCGIDKKADIKITKRIPVAAGLAGGSTDAAAVLSALNELCGYPITEEELLMLGARLGADVPFCIVGGTKYADRYGDVLHSFPDMPDCYVVVACGKSGVSTPWAYSMLDANYGNFADGNYLPRSVEPLKISLENGDVLEMSRNMYNIFEDIIEREREEVVQIKALLYDCGAERAMMSGSGPSVFGIFTDRKVGDLALKSLNTAGISAFLTTIVRP